MSVLCMLLDKKKQYFSLLADIFNITGHKLLIAFDEEKALELLKVSEPEVIIMPAEDLGFWFKLLEIERYIMPILFVGSYEDAETLAKYGLREVNYEVLPFNPMELLTKLVSLSRDPQDSASLSIIGPINLLIKLLRKGATSALIIEDEEKSCSIYIHKGIIKGCSCGKEELFNLISKDVKIRLDIYQEGKAVNNCMYKDNWEFFSSLVHGYTPPQTVSPPVSRVEETTAPKPALDLSQPIEISHGFFWIGSPQRHGLVQRNAYLRIYEKDNIKVPMLINIGTVQDYVLIRSKLEQVVGTIEAVKAVVVLSSGVDDCSGIVSFLQSNQKAFVITSLSIAQRLRALGIPQARIKAFETFPNKRLRLATGDVLRFIHLPFLPERGSFAVLEESTGFLFTGGFLSSLCIYEDLKPLEDGDPEDVLIYTNLIIPSQDTLNRSLRQVNKEEINAILPMLGNPVYSKDKIREIFDRLESGFLAVPEVIDSQVVLETCNSILAYLRDTLEAQEFQNFLEELGSFVYMEDNKIVESFIDPENIPSLILSLMYAKNITPATIKKAITHFYMAGVSITI
ncbi:hypothetical protein IAE16_01635 [Hydrogenobacter sp. T-2]|uniref:hypothetical protein n=1 Tax=Pampinifervens diazotrophicum TaxID=1632018 RepID=UPI002B257295|nr:hypothetical protein [Hydrogenobacter sp. T-2]WPM32393.1 hypothetical protein IAE16_01635 [Hydrogenobacter sp. T-2]